MNELVRLDDHSVFDAPKQGIGPKVVWSPLAGSQTLAMSCPAHILLYHGTRGPGKCFPLDTPVPTPSGWKTHGELQPGDYVFGSDGAPVEVLDVYAPITRPVYRMHFVDGSCVDSSDNHSWPVTIDYDQKKTWRKLTTLEIKNRVDKGYPVQMPLRQTVQYPAKPTVMDPYLLGAYIGDGCSNTYKREGRTNKYVGFGSIDEELLCYFEQRDFYRGNTKDGFTWMTGRVSVYNKLTVLGLVGKLTFNKFIPDEIMLNSAEVRTAFLQGLCDTDGGVITGGTSAGVTTSNLKLCNQILELVRSLGCKAEVATYIPKEGAKQKAQNWEVRFNHPTLIPFRLPRKIARYTGLTDRTGFLYPKVKSVEFISEQVVSCISVAAEDSTYIVGKDFLKTFNTDSQLMRFRRWVGQGFGRHWRGVIFDREYKNLDDLVSKSMRWFPEFKDGARFLSSKSDYRWVWPTGEELMFRTVKKASDYWSYHGQEFPWIGWNELTKYPTDELFDAMMSCNRSSFRPQDHRSGIFDPETGVEIPLPKMPLEVFATCNPFGAGHNWVKKRFINAAPMGKVVRNSVNAFNPQTQRREDIIKTQVHLFGSYRENIYLAPEYVAELESMSDKNKRKAWLQGDWDVVAGGMFDDVWDSQVHVVKPFPVPSSWRIDRAFDYGSSAPFSVGWYAESDGTEIVYRDGTRMRTVPGDTFRIAEWYGTTGKTNQGLRMLANDIAAGIVERELRLGIHARVIPGPADNSIWNSENGNSIAAEMARPVIVNYAGDGVKKQVKGVTWKRSDKSAGSRKDGWENARKYLRNALPPKDAPIREKAGFFCFNTCTYFIDLFPVLPRDEEDMDDVDTDAEDHIGDEVRYRILDAMLRSKVGRTSGTT